VEKKKLKSVAMTVEEVEEVNTKLSYCAYFLSKFDMRAVKFLSFKTRNEALITISKILEKENNYLKRRRDEFDVLTGSHRRGQWKRSPAPDVLTLHQKLNDLSFEELSDIVQRLLDVQDTTYPDDLPDNSSEYREGKKKTVRVNVYERNPAARRACINHHGVACCVCGFDFGKVYGSKFNGKIHVHHLKMVSESDKEYVIDPINDLRPVCPNCHMVLHSKKDICYTVEEVIDILERVNKK